jgi:beta-lactamase regulating signal transducer with metallopeptidase domain
MDLLLPIAAKSFLVAGVVLLLLKLAHKRSASDRSWIAHLGLAAVLLLPAAAVALPALDVEGPSYLASPVAEVAAPAGTIAIAPLKASKFSSAAKSETATAAASFPAGPAAVPAAASVDWALWAYAAPAAVLLLLTVIALGRLFALKARANVLVEPHWLTALARAQRRMGFKHGTALLTSNELPSPISWGLMRPVILLNDAAAESHDEAEAIIAHELAHVANLDWAKLLIARVTVAIFWFNPLVWVLAREAHQLREESADDAVLGADIEDTDYARLLVGVARHECRGLLLGAHGVAPGRNSLSRRVRRVLDGALARAPGGWRWSTAAAFFAAGMAVPLAVLNFVPTTPASATAGAGKAAAGKSNADARFDVREPYYAGSGPAGVPVSEVISDAVAASVSGAMASAGSTWTEADQRDLEIEIGKAMEDAWDGKGPKPGSVGPRGPVGPRNAAERSLAMKALGVTPEYVASLRSVAPQLREMDADELLGMAAVGVSADYIRDLSAAGLRGLDADELTGARAVGLTGDYIRAMAAAGFRSSDIDEYMEIRAVGVTPAHALSLRRAGHTRFDADDLVKLRVTGVEALKDVDPDDDS